MDQRELLNQIINHKMLQKILEVECDRTVIDLHAFTRNQKQEISLARSYMETDLMLKAINVQIAEEEDMFRYSK